ncbi:hypothetical protein HR13_00215 [Porphyromonas gulae]|nr:hypothetical protein HR09_09320 [Porphyromonas gulae]KGN81654.1 hypothetical protein HR13_00215 [Porphyromonas gulae]
MYTKKRPAPSLQTLCNGAFSLCRASGAAAGRLRDALIPEKERRRTKEALLPLPPPSLKREKR